MRRKHVFVAIVLLVLLVPFWMWLAWFLTPKKKLVTAIIDKTVVSKEGQEHVSLTWILNHQKFTKTKKKRYDVENDYFGFFPLEDDKFRLKGLERFSENQIDQLSRDADLVYFTDTYGIYSNEWFQKNKTVERSAMIYGGMSAQDLRFLQKMEERKKLIIAEFNCFASPTSDVTRGKFEKEFGIRWTGWLGRFFHSLDTSISKEIPQWLVTNYKADHQGKWPFTQSGIAFVNNTGKVVILGQGQHLNNPLPYIQTSNYGMQQLRLPESTKYSFWFDVIVADRSMNKIVAEYELDVTKAGSKELESNGIPLAIPAITMHKAGKDYEFYYFSGDFCDNPITYSSSYFKGISLFQSFFYKEDDMLERKSFFWKFYRPLVTSILNDYYRRTSVNVANKPGK